MDWNPFKKKEKEDQVDPLSGLNLSALKTGYVLDFDLKTWQVTAHNRYDYDGDWTDEWELSSAEEVRYLEREDDDEVSWTLYRNIPLSEIEEDVRTLIRDNDDPPEAVSCNGTRFLSESSDAGHFHRDGSDVGREFVNWTYVDDSEEKVLVIEQWGENEFSASLGEFVEEYQFSSILPGKT